jgi:hypothetical protein
MSSPAEVLPAPIGSLVSDWGYCSSCDGLTNVHATPFGGAFLHRECRAEQWEHDRERQRDELAAKPIEIDPSCVRYRPAGVSFLRESDPWKPPKWEAVVRIPDDASEGIGKLCLAIALTVDQRLDHDESLGFALARVALGRDSLQRELDDLDYVCHSRTVGRMLERLVEYGSLKRVGQLKSWEDPYDERGYHGPKRGAYVYALNVEGMKRVGELVRAAKEALSSTDTTATPTSASVRDSRLNGTLSWALQNAQQGCRNHIGSWLARRCKRLGLTEGEAENWMARYQEAVCHRGHHYGQREALRTLHGIYRATERTVG